MNRLKDSWLSVLLINIIIFALMATVLILDYVGSLILLIAIISALLYMERKGYINKAFSLFLAYKKVALISTFILLFILPFVISSNRYVVHIAVLCCVYGMVALGLNFQMGSTDMTNFASAVFFGIGAYTTAVLSVTYGLSAWLGLILGTILAVFFGLIIGAPTLGTKGYYLSLVTMALQLIFSMVIVNINYLGGADGIAGLPGFAIGSYHFTKPLYLFGHSFPSQINYLYLSMIFLVICTYVAMRVNISRIGLSLNNIAQDEVAANCLGINITRQKLLAFCLGAAFCGVAGAIYGQYMTFVGPDGFDFTKSLIIICMVILGGMDNPVGVLVGAFILTVTTEKLRDFADYQMLIYGLILIIVLIARPAGLIPRRVRNYCEVFKQKLSWHDAKGIRAKENNINRRSEV